MTVYGGDCHLCAHAHAHHRGETYGHTPCDDCAMCTYDATSAAITDLLRAHPELLTGDLDVHAAAKAAMERKSHPLLDRLRDEMTADQAPTPSFVHVQRRIDALVAENADLRSRLDAAEARAAAADRRFDHERKVLQGRIDMERAAKDEWVKWTSQARARAAAAEAENERLTVALAGAQDVERMAVHALQGCEGHAANSDALLRDVTGNLAFVIGLDPDDFAETEHGPFPCSNRFACDPCKSITAARAHLAAAPTGEADR